MKKLWILLFTAVLCMALIPAVFAADAVVYVSDGGTGDGSSESSPLGSMDEAINKVADGGKVVIVGTYTCADEYHEPAHNGNIVITGGTYVFNNGAYNRWFLEGPGSTTFENMTFEYLQGSTSLIVAQFHKLVLGEGLVFPDPGKCYVVGGYQNPTGEEDTTLESDVTVKSGNIWCVAALNRGNGTIEWLGTGHVTIEGGEISTVYGANINGNYGTNSVINIKGGKIENVRAAGEMTRRLNGNSVINITGGMIGMLTINNVMGTATVNYSGGTIGGAEKTVEPAVEEFVTDGTATLYATPDMNTKMISLFFDKTEIVSSIPTGVEIKMTVNSKTAYVNGEAKTLDAEPIIRQNRTMLPVRFVAENLGATVGWDGTTSTATVTGNGVVIEITIGATTAKVNGESVDLDSPAFIENSRTYLPVRFVAEKLGATVGWDGATSTATLTK